MAFLTSCPAVLAISKSRPFYNPIISCLAVSSSAGTHHSVLPVLAAPHLSSGPALPPQAAGKAAAASPPNCDPTSPQLQAGELSLAQLTSCVLKYLGCPLEQHSPQFSGNSIRDGQGSPGMTPKIVKEKQTPLEASWRNSLSPPGSVLDQDHVGY